MKKIQRILTNNEIVGTLCQPKQLQSINVRGNSRRSGLFMMEGPQFIITGYEPEEQDPSAELRFVTIGLIGCPGLGWYLPISDLVLFDQEGANDYQKQVLIKHKEISGPIERFFREQPLTRSRRSAPAFEWGARAIEDFSERLQQVSFGGGYVGGSNIQEGQAPQQIVTDIDQAMQNVRTSPDGRWIISRGYGTSGGGGF